MYKLTVSVPSILYGCFPNTNSFCPENTSYIPFPLNTATRGLYSRIFKINFSAPKMKQNLVQIVFFQFEIFCSVQVSYYTIIWYRKLIEKKGMTFNHDLCYSFYFTFFPPFLRRKRKEEKNNQSLGQKSCLSDQ